MDQLQQQLLKKGVSQSEIVHMSAKVGQLVKQHMMYDLKQKLINYHMTKGFTTQDKASAKFEFNTLANQLHDLQAKGALNKSIHNAVEHLQHQAKQDLEIFYTKNPLINLPNIRLDKSPSMNLQNNCLNYKKPQTLQAFIFQSKNYPTESPPLLII